MQILLVEDSNTYRTLLQDVLQRRGHSVLAVPTAEAAWEVCQTTPFSLILLDWVLPGMDGLELCRRIRGLPWAEYSVILVVTARNRHEDLTAVLAAGASDYLPKESGLGWLAIRLAVAERQVQDLALRREAEVEREALLRERLAAQAAEQGLRDLNEHLDTFLVVASHELRTPLTVIRGNVQLALLRLSRLVDSAREQADGLSGQIERVQTFLRRANQATDQQDMMVQDLLDITRLQGSRGQLRIDVCDLRQIVTEVVEEHRREAPDRTIDLQLPDSTSVPILAESRRIEQALAQYLANALKYAAPAEPIGVTLAVDTTDARVSVIDRGPGIPPEEHERIWERFYQIEGAINRPHAAGGLGLGLYLSRTIIEQHGGVVGLESRPGAGAIFWFTLPLVPQDVPRQLLLDQALKLG